MRKPNPKMAESLARAVEFNERAGYTLTSFGGLLRCEICGNTKQLADAGSNVADKLRDGWPKCHGYTMRWWTQRQIDEGEVPVLHQKVRAVP